jgi:hypothetical protein
MTRNWTPRDALIEVLMEHLYVCAPGEVEARRIIETMADEMLQDMEEAGYAVVLVEPGASGSPANTEPNAGTAH